MSPLHIYADSASQGHVGSLDPLSLCCIYAHLLFNPVNVKILPSSLWLYHLPEIPVKSLDNLSVHFCLKETHNLRLIFFEQLVSLPPRSLLSLTVLYIKWNPLSVVVTELLVFTAFPSSLNDWPHWQRSGCGWGREQPKAIYPIFALFLPAIQ